MFSVCASSSSGAPGSGVLSFFQAPKVKTLDTTKNDGFEKCVTYGKWMLLYGAVEGNIESIFFLVVFTDPLLTQSSPVRIIVRGYILLPV